MKALTHGSKVAVDVLERCRKNLDFAITSMHDAERISVFTSEDLEFLYLFHRVKQDIDEMVEYRDKAIGTTKEVHHHGR